jgi:hypothetical protein
MSHINLPVLMMKIVVAALRESGNDALANEIQFEDGHRCRFCHQLAGGDCSHKCALLVADEKPAPICHDDVDPLLYKCGACGEKYPDRVNTCLTCGRKGCEKCTPNGICLDCKEAERIRKRTDEIMKPLEERLVDAERFARNLLGENVSNEEKLCTIAKTWRNKYQPLCRESIWQADRVQEGLNELAANICDVIGYYEDKDEE